MVLFSLVDPGLLLDPPGGLFWGVNFRDHCDNIVVNSFLDMKFSVVIDTMESVESRVHRCS